MQVFRQADMIKGWFVGDFEPTALATRAAEVALKTYSAGASEERHYHKIAREITLIQSGRVRVLALTGAKRWPATAAASPRPATSIPSR